MILVFDTETTNIPSKTLSLTDPNQARIMQLAWLILSPQFEEVSCFSSYFRLPSHAVISEGAFKAHGIDRETCDKYGLFSRPVMEMFGQLVNFSKVVVAHNIWFDSQLVDIELKAESVLYSYDWTTNKHVCTMRKMTDICKLGFKGSSPKNGKYKWPKLEEAHEFCFGEKFAKAHDALADVRATARVLKWLVEKGHICQQILE